MNTLIKNKEKFREKDFVSIKNWELYLKVKFNNKKLNIFEITEIGSDFIKVRYSDSKIPFSEVEPIPINGIDDFEIYYDPIIAASVVYPNEPTPIRNTDYTYYYKSFKKTIYKNKNFQDLIKECGLQYVHEIQHFLSDKFNDYGLKINY